MSNTPPTSRTTKFYQQDIVKRNLSPHSFGIVLRCWHDAEDIPSSTDDPLMRPLERGEVGVTFLSEGSAREILPESELTLVDRTLQPGDYCKRSIDDVHSGVVTNIRVRGRLEHVISGEPVEGWRNSDQVVPAMEAEIGDYVVYDDWVGQIVELYDENIIEVSNGQLVRLPEFSTRLAIGQKGSDILPSSSMQNLIGFFMGSNRTDHSVDTVVAVKHTVYAVAWLAVNQTLAPSVAENHSRPQRFWYGKDISKLTLIRGRSDFQIRTGDKVNLVERTGHPVTIHGRSMQGVPPIHVETLTVAETETTVDILWQDGTTETLKSVDLIPYLNTDEYDCWPGDHVLWRGEDQKRPAIVQSVDAAHRTASILYPDSGNVELASLLELDAHGVSDVEPQFGTEGLGVRLGDFVFIHREGSTNGYDPPRIPRIGELEAWAREGPFYPGHIEGWRKEMAELGNNVAKKRGTEGAFQDGNMTQPWTSDCNLFWIGEVTKLRLDGQIEVSHPEGSVHVYPLQRLTRLYDSIEQLEDDPWGDEHSHEHEHFEGSGYWPDENGIWHQSDMDENMDGWEDIEEIGDAMDVDIWHHEEDTPRVSGSPSPSIIDQFPTPPTAEVDAESDTTSVNPVVDPLKIPKDDTPMNEENDDFPWKRFDILPSAPHDHAYYASLPAQPSKSFLSRLQREYRILQSSLPESIIIRTYEDRADLLRSLIIGPNNTPYEDAPFVIDWMLPATFPSSPPIGHFLSWTNGNGRGNPNLYEEGKVCLSILGTWAGDQNETWSASRSSLLQAFVSIQGLVLVKEPWFCEPAYEKLRGTEEGIVNSRLYSEKAYVLSRGFVRRALEIPLGGLEKEISWLYYTNHRLEKVVCDCRDLVEKSRRETDLTEGEKDLAIPRLTAGGIIAVERTLMKLQVLLDSSPPSLST
ncbi:uncharacterized protein BT62DRAFT_927948 [Guyanagaster necrorhizus]|uniref:UBC core domain-containing protein n=1 Tax=Guyanagaster necrorhizus TaxID=856835 RepID=A0A9P7VZW5_9AGAR|nr:uncharacterized protein BT62DRAFT_927948 [Guyanagaster necrorhizus MCA 3950]KAG7450676.1 hypothetical protein BT62DRAFT_927948 [Guyanagaster necrorhizus MCA 3950]